MHSIHATKSVWFNYIKLVSLLFQRLAQFYYCVHTLHHGVRQHLRIQGLSRFNITACTQGIGSTHAKREAQSSQSNSSKSASLVYCVTTLEVCLTSHAVEKFRNKTFHFCSSFFFFRQPQQKLAKIQKNTNILHFTQGCAF